MAKKRARKKADPFTVLGIGSPQRSRKGEGWGLFTIFAPWWWFN